MKLAIRKLVNKFGYQISRLSQPTPAENAYKAMQHLLTGVVEPIIFDVGAHHGGVSQKFRQLFPTSKIYAFEPFRDSFEQLKANTAVDPGIEAFNFGLSDRDGTQLFHSNSSSATNSLFATHDLAAQTWPKGQLETREMVQAEFRTIDSVVATLGIPRIDILKLDVQGAEYLVMAGANSTCNRGMIHLIYSEIIAQPAYKNQKRFDEALTVFYNMGFDLYNIYNLSATSEYRLNQVDVIFTRTVG